MAYTRYSIYAVARKSLLVSELIIAMMLPVLVLRRVKEKASPYNGCLSLYI